MDGFQHLDKITDKIYSDGVQKADEEAERILQRANENAKRILKEAQEQAQDIVSASKKEAKDLLDSTRAELQLKSKRVIEDCRNAVMESLSEVVVEEPVKETISSVELYQKVILQLISHSEFSRGRVILPESMQSELSDFLDREIKQKLDGLECHFSKSLQLGFRIRLEEKGYYLSFEEADFIRYFHEQLTQRSKMIIAPEA